MNATEYKNLDISTGFPPQQLPFSKKTKEWRKKCVDWADSKTFFNYSPVRKSVVHKKINYDLLNGKLHMSDMELILNPDSIKAGFIPDRIQHYPIMNSKLNVLRGEEAKRVFDYRVVVTNPLAISEIENNKKEELMQHIQELLADTAQSEEEFNQEVSKLSEYYSYEWQDMREIRANALLNHYVKEYNMPLMFNQGFMDGMAVGEEIYQCDIVGGEPVISRINPKKITVLMSGYSNKIEDADIIILEDYWSRGKIVDTFYDILSEKDRREIESMPDASSSSYADSMDNIDERGGFINGNMIDDTISTEAGSIDTMNLFDSQFSSSLLPFDLAGNIRVLRIYWKSRRKIKKVKSYDPVTGEETYNFYPETYILNKDLGEEEQIFYINEAWEGTKIGSSIYVNMRPRPIQYNRLSNPSRCHFGIVGSIYNLNDSRPFSLVDMMKQYNYLYDAVHDRLNKMLARNWGKIISLDLAKVPTGWDVDKWMYYAKVNGLYVQDSFKEGEYGRSTGVLSGTLNNASSGVIDAEFGNSIQSQINLLEFIKMEMSEVAGITKQREGQIANRETVGGVERATLQSSHITEWLFTIHEDVKKRALECFLETAKIALRGRSKKFEYILSDNSRQIINIDGDQFAEADYGLVVDNSDGLQKLQSQLETLAQAALQNQTLSFSTIMKIYNSSSLAEKQRLIEQDEKRILERAEQAQQAELEAKQNEIQAQQQIASQKLEQENALNQRDNETKIVVAEINASTQLSKADNTGEREERAEVEQRNLDEKIRQFDAKLALEKEALQETKRANLASESIQRQRTTTKKS